jgi:hypothetical protein
MEREGSIMSLIDITAPQFEGRVFSADIMANFNKLLSTTTDPLDVKFGSVTLGGKLNFGEATELTIADGAITITKSYHTVDTEGNAGSDDLTTINGGSEGDIVVFRISTTGRTIVVKDAATLILAGDFSMTSTADRLVLIKDGSNWYEICRSDNS